MFPDGDSLCLGRPGERWGTNWREGEGEAEGEGGGSSTIRYAQSQSAAFRWAPAAGSPERRNQSSSRGGGAVVRRIGGAFSLCSRASWNRSILLCDGAEVAGGPDRTDGGGAGRHLCTAAGNEHGGRHQRQSLALHYDRDRLARRQQLPL